MSKGEIFVVNDIGQVDTANGVRSEEDIMHLLCEQWQPCELVVMLFRDASACTRISQRTLRQQRRVSPVLDV
jgi:hypothetical protein